MVVKSTLISDSYHDIISLTLSLHEKKHSVLVSKILLFAVHIADTDPLKLIAKQRLESVHQLAKMEADILSNAGIGR